MLIYAINFSPVKRKRSLRCTTSSKPGRIHHVWWLDHTANACCWCDERPRGQSDQWLIGSDWLRLRVRVSGLGLVLFVSYTSVALKLGAQYRTVWKVSIYHIVYRNIELSMYRSIEFSMYRNIELSMYGNIEFSMYRNIENVFCPPSPDISRVFNADIYRMKASMYLISKSYVSTSCFRLSISYRTPSSFDMQR